MQYMRKEHNVIFKKFIKILDLQQIVMYPS